MSLWNLPNTFATLSGNQPASKLDQNFSQLAISPQYATAASGTNALAITVPLPFTAYAIGMQFYCVAAGTNSSPNVTLNVNSVGAASVVRDANTALQIGDIQQGAVVGFYYDGANFHLMSPRVPNVNMVNRIINGDFLVSQRIGGTATNITSANVYGPDRWVVAGSGTPASCTVQVGTLNPTGNGPGVGFSVMRILRSAGSYGGQLVAAQVIETANCADLQGQVVTLSFKARRGTAFGGQTLSALIRSGTGVNEGNGGLTGGTWTNSQIVANQAFTLTTSWQTFSITGLVQASALELGVVFNTGIYTGSGSANDFFEMTDIQVEAGSAPTTFQRIPNQEVLALCQRYYVSGTFSSSGARYANALGTWNVRDIEYPGFLRITVAPVLSGVAYSNCSSATVGAQTQGGFAISVSTSGAATFNAGGNYAADAEL